MAYKGNQCKHKDCQYRKPVNYDKEKGLKMCYYILDTGHSRGCDPADCTHWQDPPREPKKNNIAYGKAMTDSVKYEWVSAQLKAGGMR